MDPLSGEGHIRRDAVEGQPQVLYVQLGAECLGEGPVEVVTRKQTRKRGM